MLLYSKGNPTCYYFRKKEDSNVPHHLDFFFLLIKALVGETHFKFLNYFASQKHHVICYGCKCIFPKETLRSSLQIMQYDFI